MMAGAKTVTLKAVCAKCKINKWCVDFPEACSAKITHASICQFCVLAKDVEALSKLLHDVVKRMETLSGSRAAPPVASLEERLAEMEVQIKTLTDALANKDIASASPGDQVAATPQRLVDATETLPTGGSRTPTPTEAEPNVAEIRRKKKKRKKKKRVNKGGGGAGAATSGNPIVGAASTAPAVEDNDGFQKVKKKKSAKPRYRPEPAAISTENRFGPLQKRGEKSLLVGDSQVRGVDRAVRKNWEVLSFPGRGNVRLAKEIEKIRGSKANREIAVVSSGNDLFLRNGRTGNTEWIMGDIIALADELELRTNVGVLVGVLPRPSGDNVGNVKAMSINGRLEGALKGRRVEFVNPFDDFYDRAGLFVEDGTHLNNRGKAVLNELIGRGIYRAKVKKREGVGTSERELGAWACARSTRDEPSAHSSAEVSPDRRTAARMSSRSSVEEASVRVAVGDRSDRICHHGPPTRVTDVSTGAVSKGVCPGELSGNLGDGTDGRDANQGNGVG